MLDVARGNVVGSESFSSYGKKVTGGSISTSMLWADGDFSIPLSAGQQLSIKSTSIEDGVGGLGIRSIHLHYLDNTLTPQVEEVVLNGTTEVLTVATNIRFLQCAHISAYGDSKVAVGNITFKNIAKTETYNQINAGELRCTSSARMIPAGKRAIIYGIFASSVSGTASTSSIVNLAVTYFAGHDYTADTIFMPIGSIGVQDGASTYTLPIPYVAPEGTIVCMTCSTDKAATIIGGFFGFLENAS